MKNLFLILVFSSSTAFAQSVFETGQKLYDSGKFAQAQPYFEQDLKENPKHYQSIEYLGDIQSQSKKWNKAVVFYEKLKTAKPNDADYQYKYGGALAMIAKESNKFKALTLIGDIENSLLAASKADAKHIDSRWALVEYYLQVPAIFGGSQRKALKYAAELQKLSAVDGYLANGRISEYFGRYADAEKQYKNAIAVGNSKTCYLKLSSLYKNKMNQPEKAKKVLEAFSDKG